MTPQTAIAFSPEQLAEVRRLQGLYPDKRGALLPVLHMAQDTFGYVSLQSVECLCACEAAPMAQVDDRYELNLTPDKIDRILEGLR